MSMMSDMGQTSRERQVGRRYLRQIVILMVLYVGIVFTSIYVIQTGHFSQPFRSLIAMTPALPMFGLVAAVIQFMLSIDELQRQIHLEALAIAAGVTAALAITYTFAEGAGLPHSQAWWTFVCVNVFWVAALPFVRRRYE